MAAGKKTGGRNFKPGNAGGPGKPPLPPELKEAKRLTKTEFERLANRFLWATAQELIAFEADASLTSVERLIVSILASGISDGDHARAEWFLNRLLGKVTDKVEVRTPTPFVIQRASGEQLVLGSAPPSDEESE